MPRVIFATDLSEASGIAERLIGSITWPADTLVTVVTVVPWLPEIAGTPWLAAAPIHDEQVEAARLAEARGATQGVASRLTARGINATAVVLRGPAAAAIVDLATVQNAELIVLGSRGLGAIEGALLGSVSEAVADRAHCPVLIARTDRIRRSVIGEDGSEGARLAVEYVAGRRHLLGAETRLVGVFNLSNIWPETLTLPVDAHSVQVITDDELALRATTRATVETSAADLRKTGHRVETEFLEGPAGPTLVDEALAWRSDLVVVGTRHRTGLRRLVLGSVGRHVLHHAHCSVLQVGWATVPAKEESRALAAAAR